MVILCFTFKFQKNIDTRIDLFLFFICSQAITPGKTDGPFNLILPGCLLSYQKEIKKIVFFVKSRSFFDWYCHKWKFFFSTCINLYFVKFWLSINIMLGKKQTFTVGIGHTSNNPLMKRIPARSCSSTGTCCSFGGASTSQITDISWWSQKQKLSADKEVSYMVVE